MIIGVVAIVIVIVLVIIFFMLMKKKKTGKNEEKQEFTGIKQQPQPPGQDQQKFCNACGQGMRHISQNNRYYCDYCKKYE